MENSQSNSAQGLKFFNFSVPLLGVFAIILSYLVPHPQIWQIWLWRFIGIVLIIFSAQDAYVTMRFCIYMRRPLTAYAVGEWMRLYWIRGYGGQELRRHYLTVNEEYMRSLEAEKTYLDQRRQYLRREIERFDQIQAVCFERLDAIGFKRNASTEKYFVRLEHLLNSNQSKRTMALVRRIETLQRSPTEPLRLTPQAPAVSLDRELSLRHANALLTRYQNLAPIKRSPQMDECCADIERSLREGAVDDRSFRKTCHALERLLDANGD